MNIKFEGLDPHLRREIVDALKVWVPQARHMPAYRLGRWDGKVSFAAMNGSTYLNLLETVLPMVEQAGYEIEIEDQRPPITFAFPEVTEDMLADRVWPPGHERAGDPILLRDYQVDAIRTFLTNPQSLQAISTGAGKCVDYDTLIEVEIDENTPFGGFLTRATTLPTIKMGQLVEAVAAFQNKPLEFDKEVSALDLYARIPTHLDGVTSPLNGVIKKRAPAVTISFENGHTLTCADKHILLSGGREQFAGALCVGDVIDTVQGSLAITSVTHGDVQDFYDIGIDEPHLYRDASGIVHHNTLLTATLSLLVEPYGRSLVVVPNKSLVVQTEADYRNLGLDVGVYYGDRKEWDHKHTIATWQSVGALDKKTRRDESDPDFGIERMIEGLACVMIDEVHTAKANILKELLCGALASVPIRWGLTGTIPKEDHEALSILCSIGPVVGEVRAADLQARGVLANCLVEIVQTDDSDVEFSTYAEEYDYLVTDKTRLGWIADYVRKISEAGNTLVLVDRIETGETLTQLLPGAVFVSGSTKAKDRAKEYADVQTAHDKIIVATYGVAAVGINVPRIFNLVMVECGKSFVRTIQSVGRILRKAADKDAAKVHDITSTLKFSARHLTKRKAYYKEAEYPFTASKIDYRQPFFRTPTKI